MKTYVLFQRPVTHNLKDLCSKGEEPEQPFRLESPIPLITTQSLDKGKGEGEASISGFQKIQDSLRFSRDRIDSLPDRIIDGI